MGYLDGLARDTCPFCLRALDDFIESESYAGKFVTIDVPTDIMVLESTRAKNWLYRRCKEYNLMTKGRVRFNLESLR